MSDSWLEPSWGIHTLEQSPVTLGFGKANVYVLLESILMPNWQQDIYQHVNKQEESAPYFVSLFTDTAYEHIEQGPVLVDVTRYPSLQTQWLAQFEILPMGCVLLASDKTDASALVEALRHRLNDLKNDAPTLLRYYEPRMLLPFLGALSAEERQCFLPQVHSIYWHHQQWLSAQWPTTQTRGAQLGSWNITSQQLEAMNNIMIAIQSHEEAL